MKFWITLLGLSLLSAKASPQTRRFLIQSKVDRFELVMSGAKGSVNGKPADVKSMKDLMPMLTDPLGNVCPDFKGPPEITVKEGGTTRMIYLSSGIISDGKACLNVAGDGLFYFPIHRDFLIGPKQDRIELQSPLKLFLQGTKILDVRKRGNQWVSDSPELLLDWDFLERFENSLRQFEIRLRVQTSIGEGKPKMIVQSAGQSYEFIKVTSVMWAVKKPGSSYLEASDDWSFWHEFEPSMLEDRNATEIRKLRSPGLADQEKLALLAKLENVWSRNLRDLYLWQLVNESDSQVQAIALRRLRRKPSMAGLEPIIQFLEKSTNDDLKKEAVSILKIQNPKGPKYDPSASQDEQAKAVEFWRNWWNQNKPRD